MVRAIQGLAAEVHTIEQTIAGFADTFTTKDLTFTRATGDELSVKHLHADDTTTHQLCVDDVCVTRDQLAAVLAAANQSGRSPTPSPSSDGTDASSSADSSATPPVMQVNGDNPAHIQVGATYIDLGATIEGPQADLNLGITTYVNGAPMNPIQIDTSTVATDTIQYVATDQNGLTSTSTRTVIVEAAPSIVPTDNASSTAATGTAATSSPQ